MSTMVDGQTLTSLEIELIRKHRERSRMAHAFQIGINAAADMVISWAEQGCGGAAVIDERSKGLAEAIRRIPFPGEPL